MFNKLQLFEKREPTSILIQQGEKFISTFYVAWYTLQHFIGWQMLNCVSLVSYFDKNNVRNWDFMLENSVLQITLAWEEGLAKEKCLL